MNRFNYFFHRGDRVSVKKMKLLFDVLPHLIVILNILEYYIIWIDSYQANSIKQQKWTLHGLMRKEGRNSVRGRKPLRWHTTMRYNVHSLRKQCWITSPLSVASLLDEGEIIIDRASIRRIYFFIETDWLCETDSNNPS